MEIDSVCRLLHDLPHEDVGQASRERPALSAGEAPVEVTPIRQVAGVREEAEHVHHRHCDQRAAQSGEALQPQEAADDLDAVDLVTVYRRRDEQDRSVDLPADHSDRHRELGAGVKASDGQRNGRALTGRNAHAPYLENVGHAGA